jgi:AcrR family transcriptional regulator
MTMTQGLRERKKAETRQALSSAALRLAERLGPDRVTVESIAEASGVSPRTFFNYFAHKDDAILGINPDEPSVLLADLVGRPAGEAPLDSLRATTLAAAARFEEQADDLWARHRLTQAYPALGVRRTARFAEVERELAVEIAGRAGLDPDRDAYPALVVACALAAVRVAMTVWYEGARPEPLAEVFAATFDQLAAGLPVPAALAPR